MENLEKKVKKIVSRHLGVGEKEIAFSSHLIEDLNASPLEIADLITKLEITLHVKVAEEEAKKFSTIGDIITFFSENIDEI